MSKNISLNKNIINQVNIDKESLQDNSNHSDHLDSLLQYNDNDLQNFDILENSATNDNLTMKSEYNHEINDLQIEEEILLDKQEREQEKEEELNSKEVCDDPMKCYDEAVSYKGKNIVVSASAGCGKTTTMIKRIISTISAGEAEVEELLVVTFTRAAAQEMKLKLKTELLKKANELSGEEKGFFKTQSDKCDLSDISTIHGFCANVCREFFSVAGLSPDFKIMEENQILLYRKKVLDQILEDGYSSGDGNIFELSGIFGNRSDESLASAIENLYEFTSTMPNGQEFLDKYSHCEGKAIDSSFAKYLNTVILDTTEALALKLEAFIIRTKLEDMPADTELLSNLIDWLKSIKKSNTILENIKLLKIFSETKFTLKALPRNKTISQAMAHEVVGNLKDTTIKTIKALYNGVSSLEGDNIDQNFATMYQHISGACKSATKYGEMYRDLKKSGGLIDFNDLEFYTLQILSNDNALESIKKRYKYIFVDEFQDTNRVQDEIIAKLNNGNNIFIVGDKKQSIYGFRGADSSIFTEKTFQPDYKKIVLNRNFRSDENILNFVNLVFSGCMKTAFTGINYQSDGMLWGNSELNLKDGLPSVVIDIINSKKTTADKPQGGIYSVLDHYNEISESLEKEIKSESIVIGNRIKELIDNKVPINLKEEQLKERLKSGKSQYIEYSDITILTRTKTQFTKTLHNGLMEMGIPVSAEYAYSLKDYPEIMLLCDLVSIIENPRQDIPLAAVLNSVFAGLNEDELAEIKSAYPQNRFFESVLLCGGEDAKLFIKAENFLPKENFTSAKNTTTTDNDTIIKNNDKTSQSFNSTILDKLESVDNSDVVAATISENCEEENTQNIKNITIIQKLKALFSKLNRYHKLSKTLPISELLMIIIAENNYFDYLHMLADGEEKAHRVTLFTEIIFDNPDTKTISELLNFVESAGEKIKLPPKTDSSVNKVKLCTVHYSKGLEYPVVFIAGCGERFLFLDNKNKLLSDRKLGLAMDFYDSINKTKNPSFAKYALKHIKTANQVREEINILYVAMTRAKCRLYMVGTYDTEGFVPLIGAKDFVNARSYFDLILNDILTMDSDSLFYLADENISNAKYLLNKNSNTDLLSELSCPVDISSLKEITPLQSYKNADAVKVPLKNTVTERAAKLTELNSENIITEKVLFPRDASTSIESGNAYHKLLEILDFKLDSRNIKSFIENSALSFEEKQFISLEVVNKILNLPIFETAKSSQVYKEQPFMCLINARKLGYNYDGEVLLQGIIDLLIKTPEGLIVVDYKNSSGSLSYLAEKYSAQVNLYKKAIQQITGQNILGAYILKIPTAEIIEI